MALVACVAVAAGLAQTPPGHAVLRGAGLFQPPASYTELAFTRPQSLPAQLLSAEALFDVGFSIHNVSQAARSYRWSIVTLHGGQARTAAAGSATVAAGKRGVVNRQVLASCVGGTLRVQVRLASPREAIDFVTTCVPRNGRTP